MDSPERTLSKRGLILLITGSWVQVPAGSHSNPRQNVWRAVHQNGPPRNEPPPRRPARAVGMVPDGAVLKSGRGCKIEISHLYKPGVWFFVSISERLDSERG